MLAYPRSYLRFLLLSVLFGWAISTPAWHTATDGNKYLIESEAKYNWLQAYDQCARQGLELVVINNASKNTAFDQLLRKIFITAPDLWLGHQDEFNREINTTRPFYTISKGLKLTFSNWAEGEPNNKNGMEHCAHIRKNYDFKWNDESCQAYLAGYICEEHYLTTEYIEDLEKKRQTANKLNTQLVDDYASEDTQVKDISEKSKNDTLLIVSGLNQSVNDIFTNLRSSIRIIIAEKPYLEAVIADIGESIDKLVAASNDEVSAVSNEAWNSLKVQLEVAEESVVVVSSDFKEKLEKNTNEIDKLLVK